MISPEVVMTADGLDVISRLVAKLRTQSGLALLLVPFGRAGLTLARPS